LILYADVDSPFVFCLCGGQTKIIKLIYFVTLVSFSAIKRKNTHVSFVSQKMHFYLQENPLATKVLLNKDDIDYLYTAVYNERREENKWAIDFYGIPYEYDQSVEEEVKSLTMHLKGTNFPSQEIHTSNQICAGIHDGSCVRVAKECLKCTGERHLGIRTASYINKPALWHVKTAMEDNHGDVRKAIEYLQALSKDWDGTTQVT
jgi:hypothetical protein